MDKSRNSRYIQHQPDIKKDCELERPRKLIVKSGVNSHSWERGIAIFRKFPEISCFLLRVANNSTWYDNYYVDEMDKIEL